MKDFPDNTETYKDFVARVKEERRADRKCALIVAGVLLLAIIGTNVACYAVRAWL